MIDKARGNASKGNYKNVGFRLGEIENLPVADNSVDVVVSDCVINLPPEKRRGFKEASRGVATSKQLEIGMLCRVGKLDDVLRPELPAIQDLVERQAQKEAIAQA